MRKQNFKIFILTFFLVSCGTTHLQQSNRSPSSFLQSCKTVLKELISKKEIASESNSIIKNKWGVELELEIPSNLKQQNIAEIIKSFFQNKNVKELRIEKSEAYAQNMFDYKVIYKKNGKRYEWGVPYEPDFYLDEKKPFSGVEITSAIIESEEDERLLIELIEHLNSYGMKSAPNIGGQHVHLEAENMTARDLKRIFKAYNDVYKELQLYFQSHPGRKYINQNIFLIGSNHLKNVPDDTLLKLMDNGVYFTQGPIRFNKKYGTLEVRYFNSTIDVDEIIFNQRFSYLFHKEILENQNFREQLKKMSYQQIFKSLGLSPPR